MMLDEVEKQINQRVGEFLYGYDNTSLLQELMNALKERKLTDCCCRKFNRRYVPTGIN